MAASRNPDRDRDRERIAQETAEYQARGGEVQAIPPGYTRTLGEADTNTFLFAGGAARRTGAKVA